MNDRGVDTVQPPRVTSGGEPPPDTSSESDAQPASSGPKPKRGELRIYLGAAPGVGKTFAMLGEAHRRLERGTDLVAAVVETHGRKKTADLLDGIEIIPPRYIDYRGSRFPELDVPAVLARHPEVVLVDELAHTNTPGSKNPKRWQDVEELLDAGITVISTVNVQHLESLNDVVAQITGIEQQEKVPDEIVRAADQIELVDITPEALRRRLSHGNVYAPETSRRRAVELLPPGQPDRAAGTRAAVAGRPGRRRAGEVPRRQQDHRDLGGARTRRRRRHRRSRVGDVGAQGIPDRVEVQRRADGGARRARRRTVRGVRSADGQGARAGRQPRRAPCTPWSATTCLRALLDFAREMNATQLVIGTSRRSRWARIFDEGIGAAIVQQSGKIDVHMVTHEEAKRGLSRAVGVAAANVRCSPGWPRSSFRRRSARSPSLFLDPFLGIGGESALFFVGVLVVALLGGVAPAVLSAVLSGLLLNYFLIEPRYTFTIAEPDSADHRSWCCCSWRSRSRCWSTAPPNAPARPGTHPRRPSC